ncbi:predicted protein [Nematostella vectensis]|uniref:Uncharacterized protein n=1 Tax=Nematostella vectensis TaxID=45351 RepID=A7S648_NEMVE|nr:predicted protein [Nematostella vectensis]|eukprot:XP_001632859.1 predicted protein [Nematostella vectensis]
MGPLVTKRNLTHIQSRLDDVKVPSSIGRMPRKIENCYGGFTADHWRTWKTVFSMFCLWDILPPDDLELWQALFCTLITQTRAELAHTYIINFGKKVESFNIDTLQPAGENNGSIPVITSRNNPRTRSSGVRRQNLSSLANPPHKKAVRAAPGVSVLLANTMSIAPKIDEVRLVMSDKNPDLFFFTETWLRDTISRNLLDIPGYNFTARKRTTGIHGGIGLNVKSTIKFKTLFHLHDPDRNPMEV